MFSSLRSKLKSLRRGGDEDDDARIQRKARSAAKSINKTAAKDLLEWEDRNGYKVTRSHEAFNSSSSSGTATQMNRDRTTSTTKQAPQLASVPVVEASPTLTLETHALTDSLAVFPARPASAFELRPEHEQPSAEERQRRITLQMEVEEKERLLKEIRAIRQSIAHLKTTDAKQPPPLSTADLGGMARLSPTPSSAVRRSAPWLSGDRSSSRPQSLYTSSPATESPTLYTSDAYPPRSDRRKSVADIFAQDSPRPLAPPTRPTMSHRGSSAAAPQLPMPKDIATSASASGSGSGSGSASASGGTKTPPDDGGSQRPHRRSTSSSSPAAAAAAAARPRSQLRDVPPVPTIKRDATGAPIVASKPPPCPTAPPPARAGKTRQIIDTPEEAQKRYSAALARSRGPSQNPQRRSTMGPEEVRGAARESSSGGGGMTLAELQERHLAKLKQMQSPASEKLLQEQALSLAKAEWLRRTRVEREEQQRKRAEAEERVRRTTTAARPSLSMNGKDRRRTLSEDMLNTYRESEVDGNGEVDSNGNDAPPSPKMTAKRMSGAQKAREWRQSLASLSEETRVRALQQQQQGVNGQPTSEFGHVRSRAQSSLGLVRPAGVQPAMASPQQQQYAYPQQSMGYFPSAYSTTGQPQLQSQPQSMSRSSSHSPTATPGVGGEMSRSNSYFSGAGSTVQPSASFSHKRQLTATDLRRLREGAGPGRRPVSMALSHEASRLPQRVG